MQDRSFTGAAESKVLTARRCTRTAGGAPARSQAGPAWREARGRTRLDAHGVHVHAAAVQAVDEVLLQHRPEPLRAGRHPPSAPCAGSRSLISTHAPVAGRRARGARAGDLTSWHATPQRLSEAMHRRGALVLGRRQASPHGGGRARTAAVAVPGLRRRAPARRRPPERGRQAGARPTAPHLELALQHHDVKVVVRERERHRRPQQRDPARRAVAAGALAQPAELRRIVLVRRACRAR